MSELIPLFLAGCSGFIICYGLIQWDQYRQIMCKVCEIRRVASGYQTCYRCSNKLINYYVVDKVNYNSVMDLVLEKTYPEIMIND